MHTGIKPLEKQAFLGALRGAVRAARNLGGKLVPTQFLRSGGQGLEQGIAKGVSHVLGPEAGVATGKLIKGVPGNIAGQAASEAMVGGLLQGGISGLTADKGERGNAFLSGLGQGALTGAAFGGIAGAVGQPIANIRRSALEQAAARRGLDPSIVDKSMNQGFFKNLKTVATGRGPLSADKRTNRVLAGTNALGQAGRLGAELYVPSKILDTEEQPAAASPQQAYQYYNPNTPLYANQSPQQKNAAVDTQEHKATFFNTVPPALIGASAGNVLVGLGTDYLKDSPRFPGGLPGRFISRALPALGTLGGAYGGIRASRALLPDRPENSMQQIDFDKLLRYYKKRDAVPA